MRCRLGWVAAGLIVGCASSPPPTATKAIAPTIRRVVARLPPPPAPPPPPSCAPLQVDVPQVPMAEHDAPVPPIERSDTLRPFFDKVARVIRGTAKDHVRIAVYGDSNLTMDFTTGQMRRRLQRRFGDAGHGFIALGKPWSHYRHMDVRHGVQGYASYCCSTDPVLDAGYGISGIAAESLYGGAVSWFESAAHPAPIGQRFSHVEIFYLQTPESGGFDVVVDGEKHTHVSTAHATRKVGRFTAVLDDAAHKIEVVAGGERGRVRLLGGVMERGAPSFVVDSFGVGAMNSRAHWHQDPTINREMLALRRYDLIIFMTGANDVFTLDVTPEKMANLIANHRRALPDTPILVLTPADRGKKRTFWLTRKAVLQREAIARDNGTAFWNLWKAMGGENSMASFYRRGLCKSDYIHFNRQGGAYVGDRLVHALFRALADHAKARPALGCDVVPSQERTLAGVNARTPADIDESHEQVGQRGLQGTKRVPDATLSN